MEFQIKYNYGNDSGGWSYFTETEAKSIEELEERAIEVMNEEWSNINPSLYFMGNPTPARPTIYVNEWANGKTVKGGIAFKTKWR